MSRSEEDTQKSTSTRERLNLTLERTGALVGAVDQGTSSSRFMVFSAETGHLVASHQIPVRTRASQPGWSEQDPRELLETVITCIDQTVLKLRKLNIDPTNIRAIGITNQRETTIVWDKTTGEPLYPAILWNDNRTEQILNRILKRSNTSDTTTPSATSKDECNRKRGKREKARENENANQSINQNEGDHVTKFTDELHGPKNPRLQPQHGLKNPRLFEFQLRCGLPFSTYFSALKLVWLRENLPSVRDSMASGSLLFGTVDSWLIWNLTGGVKKGVHITDVTNASRTLLMNLHTLEWDPYLLEFFHLPPAILPEIRTSSEHYGELEFSSLKGFSLTGCLGDQQAALLGQHCTLPGQTKTTYGTGCFLLTNIGTSPIIQPGLLTTVAYKFGQEPACFAIEGSIGQAGSALALLESWGIKQNQMETATTSAGVLALPSFSGLLAPRWRPDMRGTFTGISSFTLPEHLVFATMEAIAFQVKELTDCISKTGIQIEEILVDGGLSQSSKLMQLQADILGKPVVRPNMLETTALGAALAAGRGVGLWDNIQGGLPVWQPTTSDRFSPVIQKEEREDAYERWNKFVEASLSYQEQSQASQEQYSEETSESVDTLWPAKLFTLSTLAIYMLADVLAGKW
eukprot:TRINITY_DN3508_c0_g1_i1.p1 TRINITY_DN3508_c0_g1~~TRINITY_DN3508_c0_g1_i1.p1  ORF type:complete len:649 (+),score=113.50 TRINITY_DN3508_c0_g1_i1:50-1948(+)